MHVCQTDRNRESTEETGKILLTEQLNIRLWTPVYTKKLLFITHLVNRRNGNGARERQKEYAPWRYMKTFVSFNY